MTFEEALPQIAVEDDFVTVTGPLDRMVHSWRLVDLELAARAHGIDQDGRGLFLRVTVPAGPRNPAGPDTIYRIATR